MLWQANCPQLLLTAEIQATQFLGRWSQQCAIEVHYINHFYNILLLKSSRILLAWVPFAISESMFLLLSANINLFILCLASLLWKNLFWDRLTCKHAVSLNLNVSSLALENILGPFACYGNPVLLSLSLKRKKNVFYFVEKSLSLNDEYSWINLYVESLFRNKEAIKF